LGNALEKFILIKRHRVAKSASSGGNSITQLGQHHPAMDVKRMPGSHATDEISQPGNRGRQQIIIPALQQIDRHSAQCPSVIAPYVR
jgi:hypothetical protein